MTAGTGHGVFSSRSKSFVLALASVAAAFAFVAPLPAHAQERERIGLFYKLFGNRKAEPVEPKAEIPKATNQVRKKKPARVTNPDSAEQPAAAAVAKKPDARVVLVIGDFLAGGLAEGLTTALVQNPDVRVVDRTSGSSGFVRQDFHDWTGKINELINAERPAAIVVMIGTNDRQQMEVDDVRENLRSENWNREYERRAEELAKAIAARKIPLLWVGMPSFKASKMTLDMLAFNDIYRAAATSVGGEFVDIWDGFVDENGAYIPSGPDLNGQPARLRANDGINLARPGKRKVAFYVEKPLYKILGQDPSVAAAQAAAAATRPAYRLFGPFGASEGQEPANLDIVVDPNEVGLVDPARPVALRTPALDGGEELLGAVVAPRLDARTPAEKLVIEGIAPPPLAGRADEFSGPQFASAAAAMRLMFVDRTLNKARAPSKPLDPATDRAEIRHVRSNVLAEPEPPIPPRAAPEIVEDRIEEISPAQAAPDIAAAEPPMTTPATREKASVPYFAQGNPRDLAPAREAPQQAYKRPKTIGDEPNRAPTRVPQPEIQELVPEEGGTEVPVSADEHAPPGLVPVAEARPAIPDTAPLKAPAPSVLPEGSGDAAPARAAPQDVTPIPVAALPETRQAPSVITDAPQAPAIVAPNAPVEPEADFAAAKSVPAVAPDDITGSANFRATNDPSLAVESIEEATPASPAPPTVLPEPGDDAAAAPALPAQTATPEKPPAPSVLPSTVVPAPSAVPEPAVPAPVPPAADPPTPAKEAALSGDDEATSAIESRPATAHQ